MYKIFIGDVQLRSKKYVARYFSHNVKHALFGHNYRTQESTYAISGTKKIFFIPLYSLYIIRLPFNLVGFSRL